MKFFENYFKAIMVFVKKNNIFLYRKLKLF